MSAPATVPKLFTCVVCKTPVTGEYFLAGTQIVCPGCRARVDAAPQPDIAPALAKAGVFGLGTALGAAIAYTAIAMMAGIGFSAALGWLVGLAVRKGAGRQSGLPFQLLAVALTFCSLAWTYLPILAVLKNSAALAGMDPAELVRLFGWGPFYSYFSSMTGNPIGVIVGGIGVVLAWQINRARKIVFTGPHQVTGAIDFSST